VSAAPGGHITCLLLLRGMCLRGMCYAILSVAKSLLAAGKMDFGFTILTVVAPPSEYSDDDDDDDDNGTEAGNAVLVTSIPRNMSLPLLRTFLESEKIGAGPIYDIQYIDGDESAIVYYQHASGILVGPILNYFCTNQRPRKKTINTGTRILENVLSK